MSGIEARVYLDTSALLPYYRPEPMSDAVQQLLQTVTTPVGISLLTETELASALARLVRTEELTEPQAHRIFHTFEDDMRSGLFRRMPIAAAQFKKARGWLLGRRTTLRTLDALHLACSHASGMVLLSADATLCAAAQMLGVSCRQVTA
ncbi:MAG: type II toxin-antitoxin system VapC family toxin [Nitrococcus sp.]|nr:type II toxin-antitoxin system VapC family toxin [Nitrococcus sp.]